MQILKTRSAQECLEHAATLPPLKEIVGNLWHTSEIAIFFADTGVGKSILATQIAKCISEGTNLCNIRLKNTLPPSKVLYFDFELSDRQFHKRYTDDKGKAYAFNANFKRVVFSEGFLDYSEKDFDKKVVQEIRSLVENEKSEILIIDNITYLSLQNQSEGQNALVLMKELKRLQLEKGISILILAHTPKRLSFNPLSVNDLSGSKHLSNFVDSVFAVNFSTKGKEVRYLKHIKSRSSEIIFHSSHVIECRLEKKEDFLGYEFLCVNWESMHLSQDDNEQLSEMEQLIITLSEEGKSQREIAKIAQCSVGKINSILKNVKKQGN